MNSEESTLEPPQDWVGARIPEVLPIPALPFTGEPMERYPAQTASDSVVVPQIYPLKLIVASATRVRVVYGTVANMRADPAMRPGDYPIFTLPIYGAADIIAQLRVSRDSGTGMWRASSCSIRTGTAVSSATVASLIIGSVNYVNGSPVVTNAVTGSQSWSRCGTSSVFWDEWAKV